MSGCPTEAPPLIRNYPNKKYGGAVVPSRGREPNALTNIEEMVPQPVGYESSSGRNGIGKHEDDSSDVQQLHSSLLSGTAYLLGFAVLLAIFVMPCVGHHAFVRVVMLFG